MSALGVYPHNFAEWLKILFQLLRILNKKTHAQESLRCNYIHQRKEGDLTGVLGKNLIVAEDKTLLSAQLHGKATVLGKKDLITNIQCNRNFSAVSGGEAGANSKNLSLVSLGHVGLGQQDATSSLRELQYGCQRFKTTTVEF